MTETTAANGAALLVFALLPFLPGCAATNDLRAVAYERLSFGEIEQAYDLMQAAVRENPDDLALQEQLAELRTVYYLRSGQEKVFADDDWAAVEDFERVLLADPGNTVAQRWKDKALRKLAERATHAGDDARARGRLEEALERYHEAETYVAGFEPAVLGAQRVREVFEWRRKKGHENYLLGMRAQASGLYDQTEYHMQLALEHDPSLNAAKERSLIARRRMAERQLEHARTAEERRLYETALRQYREVLDQFPDLTPDLVTKVAAMQREANAARKLEEATLLMKRGDFARARPLLEEAYELSLAQRSKISQQLVALREADLDQRYTVALDLELDYHYEEALRAYQAIDAAWPGQLDVRTRIQNLETALEYAREAQARGEKAEAAGDLEGAISAYREALTYVPKFGDLAERIAKLRDELRVKSAEKAGSGASEPSSNDSKDNASGAENTGSGK